MARTTFRGLAVAGLVVGGALGGCASGRQGQQAAAPPPAQSEAQRAVAQAAQTDRQLAQARQRLEAAHKNAVASESRRAKARQELTAAEQAASRSHDAISREQASVQRLDVLSREQHARADQALMDAQAAQERAQGLQSASGRIVDASPNRVILQADDGRTIAFDVDARTRVLVGTEHRSVADLQQGADARVAYDARGAEPTAVAIHVPPARGRPAEQQAPAPQPAPQR